MKVNIGNNEFNVKVCVTPKQQKEGMQHKTFDGSFDGMLFPMKGNHQSFWMKDCIVSLDIIMIEDDTITKIHHDCPPCRKPDCPSYHGTGNIVLELPGGTCKKLGIFEGDYVDIPENKLDKIVFKYLDLNLKGLEKRKPEYYEGVIFAYPNQEYGILGYENNGTLYIYYKLIDEISSGFGLNGSDSKLVIGRWVSDRYKLEVIKTFGVVQGHSYVFSIDTN